jgi:predicted lipid-binding transport protein (Tim44 family)
VFDIYTIIFLALAIFIFARLRSVLGQRTGRERPPYDPYSARDTANSSAANDKVVSIPGRAADAASRSERDSVKMAAERWKGIAETNSPLAAGLDAIAKSDPQFDVGSFLDGARAAYEIIVTAFAEGDRRTLRNLLARDVFDGFAAAISERENRGQTMESRFVSIEKTEIVTAEVKNRVTQITVRFASQLISVTRGQSGEVVDGNPDHVTEVIDIWTFAREIGSRDPNWKLIATEAAAV